MELDNILFNNLELTKLNIKDLLLLLKIIDELNTFSSEEEIEVI